MVVILDIISCSMPVAVAVAVATMNGVNMTIQPTVELGDRNIEGHDSAAIRS